MTGVNVGSTKGVLVGMGVEEGRSPGGGLAGWFSPPADEPAGASVAVGWMVVGVAVGMAIVGSRGGITSGPELLMPAIPGFNNTAPMAKTMHTVATNVMPVRISQIDSFIGI